MRKNKERWLACFLAVWLVGTWSAAAAQLAQVIPIGRTAGIQMQADGLLVESVEAVSTAAGMANPAKQAGFQPGDIVQQADGKTLENGEQLQKQIALSAGKPMYFTVKRGEKSHQLTAMAVQDKMGTYRLGLTIRDGIAGIGTITYVDPATGQYGALGHGICDGQNGVLVPLKSGRLMESVVIGVTKGAAGAPGCLRGDFTADSMGSIRQNTVTGIFGTLTDDGYYRGKQPVQVAEGHEIKTGAAVILSNVAGRNVQEYRCEIEKVYGKGGEFDRSMTIRVTDPALLQQTGGIVQGMSGSPILQNGKLIGAVTHVLISDSTRGYAVQMEKMLETAKARAS